jgi:hypothetical protein
MVSSVESRHYLNCMAERANEQWWRQQASTLTRRVGWGWWWQGVLSWIVGLNLTGAALLLLSRRAGVSAAVFGWAYGTGVVALFVISASWARRRTYSLGDALAALDLTHGLHARLTAAAHGVGGWPPPPDDARNRYRWNLRRASIAPALSWFALAVSMWLPIHSDRPPSARSMVPPAAWETTEQWIETLADSEAISPDGLMDLREQLHELRSQPMEQWYSHGSLEAGDSLRQRTAAGIEQLSRNLETAWAAAQRLRSLGAAGASDPLSSGLAEWREAMQQLTSGALTLDPQLTRPLQRIKPSQSDPLTEEDLERIREAVEKGLQACRSCQRGGEGQPALVGMPVGTAVGTPQRGPGAAPLTLREAAVREGSGRLEPLPESSLRNARLGDTLSVVEVDHEIDPSRDGGPQDPGDVAVQESGGQAVWRDRLAPDEQAVVSRYFE